MRRAKYLLPANTATWTYREGLGSFFDIKREFRVAKPALRGEDIGVCEIGAGAVSGVGAKLHICLCETIS